MKTKDTVCCANNDYLKRNWWAPLNFFLEFGVIWSPCILGWTVVENIPGSSWMEVKWRIAIIPRFSYKMIRCSLLSQGLVPSCRKILAYQTHLVSCFQIPLAPLPDLNIAGTRNSSQQTQVPIHSSISILWVTIFQFQHTFHLVTFPSLLP